MTKKIKKEKSSKDSGDSGERIVNITEDISQDTDNGYTRSPHTGFLIETNDRNIDIRISDNTGCCENYGTRIYKNADTILEKYEYSFMDSHKTRMERGDLPPSDLSIDQIKQFVNENDLTIKKVRHIGYDYCRGTRFIFEKSGDKKHRTVPFHVDFIVYNYHNGYYAHKWFITDGTDKYGGSL